jgi:uncharacterized protein (TIGR03032 family)
VIDIDSGEVIARGLSMPHSPRWYAGKLWVLESGAGALGVVDLNNGRYELVAKLPGFTRGLDFVGRYAFVGLSQVRETAVFSGIPITERMAESERTCGVWVIDIVTGQTVALLQFTDGVQEIFAVQATSGRRYPELVQNDAERIAGSFVLPDEALDSVPAPLRDPSRAHVPSNGTPTIPGCA